MSEIITESIRCQKCKGTGELEYELDHWGFSTEWGSCNAPGCVNGEIVIEICAGCRKSEDECRCEVIEVAA